MNSSEIRRLTIKELLSQDNYLIPIYQRNYDWGEKESLQLIEDISDYAAFHKDAKYYIGSLVIFPKIENGSEYLETIDGQQRLTTLSILMSVLKTFDSINSLTTWYLRANISYAHRDEADNAIQMFPKLSEHPAAANIVDVFRILSKNILKILEMKGLSLESFAEYLLSNVIIVRIPVPADTQLNHYFEIMNSRGEQLEKHEVLKAILMKDLDKKEHELFHEIWEACSDMNSYTQMNFLPRMRRLIFGEDWSKINFSDFNSLSKRFTHMDDDIEDNDMPITRTINKLFLEAAENNAYDLPEAEDKFDSENDRFGSVINFPNFLLHVLKVMYKKYPEYREDIDQKIKLDDKRLIDIFTTVLQKTSDRKAFVKDFIMKLLSIRFAYDKYVIKREYYNGKESWSLKRAKKYEKSKVNYVGTFSENDSDSDEGNREVSKDIIMLESMFHVSAPTQSYKHWLNAVLFYLDSKQIVERPIEPTDFRNFLYQLSCHYMVNRYIGKEKTDFEKFIYNPSSERKPVQLCWEKMDCGCQVENFIFNFYDYITWKEDPAKYQKFEFSYRTSVEHFYPQTPMMGYPVLNQESGLNDFGNLCLISRGMNSKFSNNMPVAKYKNFGNDAITYELSLKLVEMFEVVKANGEWGTEQINEFEQKSQKRIMVAINPYFECS